MRVSTGPVAPAAFAATLAAALLGLAACGADDPTPAEPADGPSAAVTAEATGYTVRDLGTLGGNTSYAADINNAGGVVGTSFRSSGQPHAFLWRAGTMKDLGALAGGLSEAYAINDDDVIVGYSTVATGAMRAVRWQNGARLNLGTLGGKNSVATAVNDFGVIAGWSETTKGQRHAFVWQNGVMTDLGALQGGFSSAAGINRAGKVVGWSWTGSYNHAVTWKNGVLKDLGTNGRLSSVAAAINTKGEITGSLGPYPDAEGEELDSSDPFVFLTDTWTVFHTRYTTSDARAINGVGTVVGSDIDLRDEEGRDRAWVRPAGGSAAYLPDLNPGNSVASGINDFGNIVGSSAAPSGFGRAVLWRHQ
jgi:probable HAF family extracellular repeat protein